MLRSHNLATVAVALGLTAICALGNLTTMLAQEGSVNKHKGKDPNKAADRPTKSTAQERDKAFTWFGTLGYRDTKGLKLARVATGEWYKSGDNPPQNTYVWGFLLKEKEESFSVLTLSLTEKTYQKTGPKTEAHKQKKCDISELEVGATAILKALHSPKESQERDSRPLWAITLHSRTEMFVLAHACWRNGLDELAAGLFDQAAITPTGYGYNSNDPPTKPLQELVANDLAHTEMWRTVVAFGDPVVPRKQLLENFEHIVKNFPNCEYQDRAKESVTLLRQMIKEDDEHQKKESKPFNQLSKKEQIADLIFRLRDQNGHQFSQPGSCDIFDEIYDDKKDSPAHELVKTGFDAIPQLIEALDDQRFTRSVGYHRNFYFSHYELRISDCALAILERIAGRSFWQSSSTFSYMTKDKKVAETKKVIQEWYAELQKKGEKQLLIEAVGRGDRHSYDQAVKLLEKYPNEALAAITTGIEAAHESRIRDLLVASVGHIESNAALPLLLKEVKEGPFAYGRLVAAKSLYKRGRPEGVAAMIAEWNGQRPKTKTQSGKRLDEKEGPNEGLSSIARFLAGCGQVEAIQVLAKDLRKRSLNLRAAVVSAFGESENLSMISGRGGISISPGDKNVRDNPKEVLKAIEQLLISQLDDTGEQTGLSGTWNGESFSDPRICDVAAFVLKQLFSEKYSFALSAPKVKRDRAIIEIKNTYRKSLGLAPLQLAASKVISIVPDEKLQPLVELLLKTPEGERRKAEQPIEELGLGALPGILKSAEKLPKNDIANRKALDRLAARLSCIVNEANVTKDSMKPSAEVASKLKAIKGKPIDPDSFVDLVKLMALKPDKSVHALRITIERPGDGTGISISLELIDQTHANEFSRSATITADSKASKDTPSGWGMYEHFEAGRKHLWGSNGACTYDSWQEDKHGELRDALIEACASAPDLPIYGRILLIADWTK